MPIKKAYLSLSILLSILLCIAQITGSRILVLPCLGAFLLLLGWSCFGDYTLPVLLFFLPWSPILKMDPGSYSFFTFGLVLICAVGVVKKRFRFKRYPILAGIMLTVITLIAKLIEGEGVSFDYISFLMLIVLFPTVKGEWTVKKYDYFQVVIFLSLGVIIAAICALNLAVFPNISRYIRVDEYLTIVRRSGFYGDANFYTAQITAALSGCLMLVLQERNKGRLVTLWCCVLLLMYCGLLSASKSFVLVAAVILLVWIICLVRMEGRAGLKLAVLVGAAVLLVIVASSTVLGELIGITTTRFSYSTDLDSFTTGRIQLWEMYVEELFSNPKTFFLGKGFTNLKINGRASHNTILQAFFQFGIVGVPFLCYWIVSFFRGGSRKGRLGKGVSLEILVVAVGAFLPWMAIDTLFFDDFFLMQWYVFCAVQKQKQDKITGVSLLEDSHG